MKEFFVVGAFFLLSHLNSFTSDAKFSADSPDGFQQVGNHIRVARLFDHNSGKWRAKNFEVGSFLN